jgi:hypothetical protein
MCLSFKIATGPSQRSPAGLMATFYCLRFETPATWRARSRYLYPPGTGWPTFTPRYSVPFRRLLRLARLRWRYSTPPPHFFIIELWGGPRRKHRLQQFHCCQPTSLVSESYLPCDWRFTANQFVLAPSPRVSRPEIFFATESLRS